LWSPVPLASPLIDDQAFELLNHTVILAIQQKNIDFLQHLLLNVSDPTNTQYGNFLSFQEVGTYVANWAATNEVRSWLNSQGVDTESMVDVTPFGEYLSLTASIREINIIFNAQLSPWILNSPQSPENVVLRSSSFSVPESLPIYGIFNLLAGDFPPATVDDARHIRKLTDLPAPLASSIVTPSKLRTAYKANKFQGSSSATQAVFATIGQNFAPEDIELFQSTFGLPIIPVEHVKGIRPANTSFCSTHVDSCAEALLDLEYIMALAPQSPTSFIYVSAFSAPSPFVKFVVDAAASPNPSLVNSISYGMKEAETWTALRTAFDNEAVKLGLRGVSILVASGDDGVSGNDMNGKDTSQCGYYAHWPGSSPWVTSVGATMGGPAVDGSTERVCSSGDGSVITSGGGFSSVYTQPTWQRKAVSSYLSNVSPKPINSKVLGKSEPGISQGFNPSKRAFPDVSFPGDLYLVSLGARWHVYSGTSASAPALAGIISLANAARIKEGLAPLGYLNPLFYSGASSFTRDVIHGTNACMRGGIKCCDKAGFSASNGWDPATGWGSVDAEKLIKYVLQLGEVGRRTLLPTVTPTARTSSPSFGLSLTPTNPSIRPVTLPSGQPSSEPSHLPAIGINPPRQSGGEAAFGYAAAMLFGLAFLLFICRRGPCWVTDLDRQAEKQKPSVAEDILQNFPEASVIQSPMHE